MTSGRFNVPDDKPGWTDVKSTHTMMIAGSERTKLSSYCATMPSSIKRKCKLYEVILWATETANTNSTSTKKTFLKIFYLMKRTSLHQIRRLVHHEHMLVKSTRTSANSMTPKCASACEIRKTTKRPTKNDTQLKLKQKGYDLKKEDLMPIQRVSENHKHYKQPRRTYVSRGSKRINLTYCGLSLASDHPPGHNFIGCQ